MLKETVFAASLVVASLMGWAAAQGSAATNQVSSDDLRKLRLTRSLMDNATIADKHPDVYYRNLGIRAYQDGYKDQALTLLLKSASYADKIAQAMVATMYWNGEGTSVDRPRAYAWMDLAADRGYREFLVQREHYWGRLNENERKQALDVGREVYAYYSDERGLDRLQMKLSAVATQALGSHAGWQSNGGTIFYDTSFNDGRRSLGGGHTLQDVMEGSQGESLDNSKIYDTALWNAKEYARLKDLQWNIKAGHVEVGDLQVVPGSAKSSATPP